MAFESTATPLEVPHPYIPYEEIDPQEHLFSGGSKGLIFVGDTDDVIVYRRDMLPEVFPGYIDLIGGGSDVGPDGQRETPYETAEREAWEEVGVKLAPEIIVYAAKFPFVGLTGLEGRGFDFGVFFVARIAEPGESGLRLGGEGSQDEGAMRMPIKELIDPLRRDVWPAFQQLARQYYYEFMLTGNSL